MRLKLASDALKKHFLQATPCAILWRRCTVKSDVSVVHRILYFSVPLLVDSSGRGGLTSAEIEEPQQTASKSPEPRTQSSRGFRFLRKKDQGN
jgi:hypothetical protein